MRRLAFRDFSQYMKEEGYNPSEILNLFWEVKKMTPTVRSWFLNWFYTGVYPADVVEDVTVQMLVDEAQMKPINAFIAIDWLLTDPEAAKFALTHVKHAAVLEEDNVPQTLPEEPNESIIDA